MAYIGTSPSNGIRRKYKYTATAAQTSFTGNDDNGIAVSYVDTEYLDVYQNGVKLVAVSDYASTTGTSVVLVQAASADDIIELVVFDVFGVADSVSQSAGGSFAGNVGMGGTLAVTGVPTFTGRSVHSGGITVANGGQIGSVGDADAIAIASNGVVTFSQAPIGSGYDLLLNDTISSTVAQYDISSTYINGTYNSYYLEASLLPETDEVYLNSQVFVGGAVQTGSIYAYEGQRIGGATTINSNATSSLLVASDAQFGNAAGEGITISMQMQNANSTTRAFCVSGISNWYYTDGNHNASAFAGTLIVANRANVVNGLRLMMSGDGIASGTVTLYGLRK